MKIFHVKVADWSQPREVKIDERFIILQITTACPYPCLVCPQRICYVQNQFDQNHNQDDFVILSGGIAYAMIQRPKDLIDPIPIAKFLGRKLNLLITVVDLLESANEKTFENPEVTKNDKP